MHRHHYRWYGEAFAWGTRRARVFCLERPQPLLWLDNTPDERTDKMDGNDMTR